jgi:hypothetical protein
MTTFRGHALQLWREVSRYQLDPAEIATLREACTTLTELERMEDELAEDSLLISGSKGQLVINPLVGAIQGHRKVFEAQIRALALPILGEETGTYRSPGRRRAAKTKAGIGLKSVPSGQSAS